MNKYRKKPVVIEAMVWDGNNSEVIEFARSGSRYVRVDLYQNPPSLFIETLEGTHEAKVGDYIIKGVKGEIYPCKPDIFEMTYEKAEEIIAYMSKARCISAQERQKILKALKAAPAPTA